MRILGAKKRMKAIKLKQINLEDLYVTRLTKRGVPDETGKIELKPTDRTPKPTGSILLDAIAQLLAEDCTVSAPDLAQAIGTKPSVVNGVLRLLTGMALHEIIRAYQLKCACEYLACTDVSRTEIARRCGFFSASNFAHVFTQHMKCSPMDYRRLHRPDNFRELYAWEP